MLKTHRKGFSLIEAAIVLGIVGLVIGGIWAAASAVQENLRLSTATRELIAMRSNIQKLYYRQDMSGASMDSLLKAGVFPAEMVNGSNISLPWPNSNIEMSCSGGGSLPWDWINSISFCVPVNTGIKMNPKDCLSLHRAMVQAKIEGVLDMGDDGQSPFGWPLTVANLDSVRGYCNQSATSFYNYAIFINIPRG